ncbi:hypothetical protein H920_09562 [Fukomys damarensis]|uniref:Uncharacterized protein n=1 Tax=Fukomys damarensis TaxID=885580 RepID=A0A091DFI8_FUKDA|nr:hypothetical protein H920_09562 [Fukomys damarensis]
MKGVLPGEAKGSLPPCGTLGTCSLDTQNEICLSGHPGELFPTPVRPLPPPVPRKLNCTHTAQEPTRLQNPPWKGTGDSDSAHVKKRGA